MPPISGYIHIKSGSISLEIPFSSEGELQFRLAKGLNALISASYHLDEGGRDLLFSPQEPQEGLPQK